MKILLADDDEPLALAIKETLSSEGFAVNVVADGEAALQWVEKDRPDLLVLDIMLPGLDGWEVLHQIRKNPLTKELPVLVLTAKTHRVSKLFAFDQGADDYMTKPFDAEELLARTRAILGKKGRSIPKDSRVGASLSGRIGVRRGPSLVLLDAPNIAWIEAKYNRCSVHAHDEEYFADFSLTELESRLAEEGFVRTHRHYLVNINFVSEIIPTSNSGIELKMTDKAGTCLPVSHRKSKTIRTLFGA